MKAAAGQGGGGIGGKLFQSSLSKGGGFANSVVGSIAKSDISSVGTMTGDGAAQALASYMGYAGETGGAETPNGQFDGNTGDGESYIDNGVPVDGGAPLNQGVTINSAESYGNSENESAPLNQGNSLSLFKNFGNSGALSGNENPDSNSYAGNTETLGAKEQPIVSGQQGLSGQIGHTGQGGLSGETGGKVQPTADGQAIVSAGQGLGGQAHIGQGTTGGIDKPSEDGQAFYAGQGGAIGHIPDAAPIQNGGVSSDTDPAFTVSGPIGNVSSENGAIPSNSDPAFTVRETVTGSGAIPAFSNVEIGGGRITGVETSSEYPAGVQFGMYSADKYLAPESNYHTLKTVDGAKWYKQYATNAVEKTPYNAPDGTVAYKEKIVQKLPKMPIRKDRA
jgi:hypothetical protein